VAKRRHDCRPVSGVFLLDKPQGISSNAALQEVKRQFAACKAGHAGSLDPLASGLLPICLGEATKVAQFLLDADKAYSAVFRLGVTTDTYDAEGDVVQARPVSVRPGEVEKVLARFTGWIDQVPPMYSAIKQGGQPLYKRARAGLVVDRASRRVHIRALTCIAFGGDRLEVEVRCSKGTYIRSLAYDIGEALGCGAHVASLRRTATAGFAITEAIGLDELKAWSPAARDARLLPVDTVLAEWPALALDAGEVQRIQCGLSVARLALPPGVLRLYGPAGFVGMGEVGHDGRVVPKRLMAIAATARAENVG
jgi:tRNA pseudouridine55 synthase